MNTIIGIFDDQVSARRALETLRDGPLQLEDISIIAQNADGTVDTGDPAMSQPARARRLARSGAGWSAWRRC